MFYNYIMYNKGYKYQRKPKEQPIMDNRETQGT